MRIELPSGTPAELVTPSVAPAAGLVIAPDIFGLRPLFVDMAERIAAERRLTVAVAEPFPGRALGPEVEPRYEAAATLNDGDVLRDLQLAAEATSCESVGLIGFCMGGMYALKAAGLGVFHRCVAFYGMIRVPQAWRAAGNGEPLEWLGRPGASQVLAIIGGRDHYTPPADVAALEAVPGVTVVRYPEAEHGFVHDASRPTHRAADAANAWSRAFAFLDS